MSSRFEEAFAVGRPPNITRLFPNSKALIVSGKAIDRAMIAKGGAMTIAANGRSSFAIRGALQAAQRANAAIIVEIAKSEGGANAYCAVSLWNLARHVDAMCNELGITVPVAIHVDHYFIKSERDLETAPESRAGDGCHGWKRQVSPAGQQFLASMNPVLGLIGLSQPTQLFQVCSGQEVIGLGRK